MFPKDSKEYKLLLRYTQKTKNTSSLPVQGNGVGEEKVASPAQPQDNRKSGKRKKHRFLKLISCIHKEDDGYATRPYRQPAAAVSDQEEVEQIVKRLTKIAHSVHILPAEIEADCGGGYFMSG